MEKDVFCGDHNVTEVGAEAAQAVTCCSVGLCSQLASAKMSWQGFLEGNSGIIVYSAPQFRGFFRECLQWRALLGQIAFLRSCELFWGVPVPVQCRQGFCDRFRRPMPRPVDFPPPGVQRQGYGTSSKSFVCFSFWICVSRQLLKLYQRA